MSAASDAGTSKKDSVSAARTKLDAALHEAIRKRNAGEWLTRKQFWLLKSRGIDPLGPSDDEHSTKVGWCRWRERVKGLNSRNYPFATGSERF
jgi:hypothetical protein